MWGVGVHGEDALGDDEDGVLGVGGADAGEVAADGVVVEVAEELDRGSAGGGALAQGVVGEPVEEDVVAAVHQGADGAEARGPAGREQCDVVGVEGLGESGLQGLADRVGAAQGGGARGKRAVVAQGLVGGVEDGGVAGEGEVVLAAEVGAVGDESGVGDGGGAGGEGRVVSAEVGPQVGLFAVALPGEVGVVAGGEVGAGHRAEAHDVLLPGIGLSAVVRPGLGGGGGHSGGHVLRLLL